MRLRNIPGADEIVASSPFCIQDPLSFRGKWNTVFENDHPVCLEVGMGKGQFLLQLAKLHPKLNYIGIERYSSVLLRALQKLDSLKSDENELPKNIRFLCVDASQLPDFFAEREVQRIYLNFSDPWPKDRHSRRRLTSKEYLQRYDKILSPDGCIEFKTDNKPLFEFSLNQIEEAGWKLDACTYDLHKDESMNAGNIMTEYEEKFSSLGNPIFKLIASRK